MMSPESFPPSMPADRPFDIVGLGGNAVDRIIRLPRHPIPGEKLQVAHWVSQGGGRAATALVAAARFGLRICYLGGVGDDAEGRESLARLREEGIDTSHVRVRPGGLTQRAFILVEETTGERTILWGRGEGIMLEADEIEPDLVRSGRLFYTDAQNPPASAHAARLAKEAGMPVLADLESPRPGTESLLPMLDLLIASSDFPEAATGASSLEEATRVLEESTSGGLIVVTRGAGGAVARIGGRLETFPAYAVDAIDTTGAGDVFHGAFATACILGLDLRDAIDFGNAVAAMKCRRLGGRDGIPRSLEEVARFRRETAHRRPSRT